MKEWEIKEKVSGGGEELPGDSSGEISLGCVTALVAIKNYWILSQCSVFSFIQIALMLQILNS